MLLACGESEAVRLERALSAADFPSALAACAELAPPRADRCRVEVAELHRQNDDAACAAVVDPFWRDECAFQRAERLAAAGEAEAAMALCAPTRFARECTYHLLRYVARGVVGRSPAEAAAALAPWLTLPTVRDAPRLFWKAWFREGRAAGGEVSPEGCPDEVCFGAARETLFESLRAVHRADPVGFCASPPSGAVGWAAGPTVAGWSARWAADTCGQKAPGPAQAIPPPP